MKYLKAKHTIIIIILMIITSDSLLIAQEKLVEKDPKIERKWWKEAVVYQIYPRSFKDTDGDGVGDLKGIISKLDYIKSLGIEVVWLNPIYGSPNADNGYDISDYQAIMKEFGTMEDFDVLLKGMHERGLKLVMDLVVNHSSDEHKWFQESRKSRDNPYRDYYHWWPAEKGKPAFRPGAFEADGSGWRYDKQTDSYYLHYFNYKQPDLNWENPKLRQEIFSMMNWWFQKGIDGFRMDVIPFIAKDTTFPVITQEELDKNYQGRWDIFMASGPHLHDYLKEMNKEVLSKYDCMTLAEGAGMTLKSALDFVDADRKELDMGYHFEGTNLGYVPGYFKKMGNYSLVDFKKIYSDWDNVYAKKGWGTIYLGNHDQPRMTSRWGNDAPEFRVLSSKMLTTFLLTMGGTPYYYNGDEIGMINVKFNKIEDYRDIETLAEYEKVKIAGGDLKQFIEDQKTGGARDNGRTPFQWNASKNGGFSLGEPWLKVNDNHIFLNAEAQEKDPNSNLNYFRKMTKLRKSNLALVYGKYTLLDVENPNVYSYTREFEGKKLLVMLNFTSKKATANIGINTANAKVLINNYPTVSKSLELRPYEAVVLELK
ncbi:glycoside hydrolase family 13 protein [Flavobacterium franklandianum]|uniref:glycoside hydrolase family 13 protein n=1 Tax=Flavobacterium franklandianum TaxID=2594430 RepID=UPI0029391FAC|nr:alpha-glucosidase [Flavobacterium franklandianum]